MEPIKRYREFKTPEESRDFIINTLYDRIIPGIRDILSTYQDDQEDTHVKANVVDPYNRPVSKESMKGKRYHIGHLRILVRTEDRITPISHVKDILNRILSEFGDEIGIQPRIHQHINNGDFDHKSLEFYLLRGIDPVLNA